MRVLPPLLVLVVASPAAATPPTIVAPMSAPAPIADAPAAPPAPVVAPVPVQAPADAEQPAAPPAPRDPAASPRPLAPVVPTQALVEKIGQGDRLFLAADYRNALFAYQDAVYMQPRYAPARVRLGRAYLALRYPAQATAQAEAAIAADPESADARALLEEAKNAPARAVAPEPTFVATGIPAAQGSAAAARASPRVFKFTPESDVSPAPVAPAQVRVVTVVPASVAADPQPTPSAVDGKGTAPVDATGAPPSASGAPQLYRAALVHLQDREWAKAVAALSDALLADPKLAVAHSARGSAQFGLGKYREAAEDYRSALALDPKLATPLYGLAECHRVLGDPKRAAEMYERYAQSSASDVRDDLRAVAAKRAQELR